MFHYIIVLEALLLSIEVMRRVIRNLKKRCASTKIAPPPLPLQHGYRTGYPQFPPPIASKPEPPPRTLSSRMVVYTILASVVFFPLQVVMVTSFCAPHSTHSVQQAPIAQKAHKKPVKKKPTSETVASISTSTHSDEKNDVPKTWKDYGFDINGYAEHEARITNGKYGENVYTNDSTLYHPSATLMDIHGDTLSFIYANSYAYSSILLDEEEPLAKIFELAAYRFLAKRHAVTDEDLVSLERNFPNIAKEAISKNKDGKFSIDFVYFIAPKYEELVERTRNELLEKQRPSYKKKQLTLEELRAMDEISRNEYFGDKTYHASYDIEIQKHAFRFIERNRSDDDVVSPATMGNTNLHDVQSEYDFPYRVWTSRAGSKIYAKIQSFSGDETEIKLEREDGKTFTLKISQLSDFDADQAKTQIDRSRRIDNEK